MFSLLDNDVDTRSRQQQYPTTDLVATYIEQAGNKFSGLGSAGREHCESTRAQDLWDYLGDFA